MSSNYADRLKEYDDKGVCGLPELSETVRTYNAKIQQLFDLIDSSSRIVILTGAGISTSAGIPDFRGPNGIWTIEMKQKQQQQQKQRKKKQQKKKGGNVEVGVAGKDDDEEGKKIPAAKSKKRPYSGNNSSNSITTTMTQRPKPSFVTAKPTYTHIAICVLLNKMSEKFTYLITQNVDGLHRRSGVTPDKMSVMHGCVFTEICSSCGCEHFRNFEIGTISRQKTGRCCEYCLKGSLHDTLLDWDDDLPQEEYEIALDMCENADLVLCLGTSLRIQPVGDMPLLAKKFVIVNLQVTPHDESATLIIRERVDIVMKDIMEKHLHLPVLMPSPNEPIAELALYPKQKTKKQKQTETEE